MAQKSIFSKIIDGDEPGEIVYLDEFAAIILTRAPNTEGHCLVVPRRQAEFYFEMIPEDYAQLMQLARRFAKVLQAVFEPKTVALIFMGLGVPHVHAHLAPVNDEQEMDHAHAVFVELDALKPAAEKIRAYLAEHPFESIQ